MLDDNQGKYQSNSFYNYQEKDRYYSIFDPLLSYKSHKTLVIAKCKSCGKEEIISVHEEKGLYFNWAPPEDKIIFI